MARDRPARPTIADVAREAGVSKGLVSFALNDRPGVAPNTRLRILGIADDLGWRPSVRARSLSTDRAFALGLVIARDPDILAGDPFFPSFISGIESVLAPVGQALVLSMVTDEDAEISSYRQLAAHGRVDGVILTDLRSVDRRIPLAAELGLRAVTVGHPDIPSPFPAVGLDDSPGIWSAVTHLADLGHRRIAHVGGPARMLHGSRRRESFETALRDLGLPPGIVIATDFSASEGARATSQLLELAERPTAIVYSNDPMAIAGLGIAQRAGLTVPDDLSITGFDGSDVGAYLHPSLTTVTTTAREWGGAAARTLLRLIDGDVVDDVELEPARLVIRDSSAAPPRMTPRRIPSDETQDGTDAAHSTRRPHVKRRTAFSAALLATGALALTACSGGGGGGGSAGEGRGDITIWYSNNEQEIAWGEQMVEAWNADHPDEQIDAQEIPAGDSSEEVIGAAITAGNAPCLIYNTAPSAVGQFERQGGLIDLSTFEDGASYIEERSGDLAEQYQNTEGDYFQMPWKSNPVVIFYNKDMFAAAGLDPENPELATYDDFLATSRALVEAGVAPTAIQPAPTSEFFQTQFDFYPLYAAATDGMQLVDDGTATFADEAGYEVAEFWATMYEEGLSSEEQFQGDSFADGNSAMAIVGPWAVSVYDDVNWGSVPVPTAEGKSPDETWTFSDAKNIGLYSACENQATAWDVLKFSTSEDQDGQLLELTGQMPLRADLQETYSAYFEENEAYQQFGDQASRTVEVPPGPNTVEILQTFRDAWSQAVIFGEGDVQTALDDAAAEIDEIAAQ